MNMIDKFIFVVISNFTLAKYISTSACVVHLRKITKSKNDDNEK